MGATVEALLSTDYPIRATRAYIDLDALVANIEILARRARSSSMAVAIKADAYGHGAIPIAQTIESLARPDIKFLAVANLQEALVLRSNFISTPVMILEDLFVDEIEKALTSPDITLTAGSIDFARAISDTAERLGIARKIPIHINIETGMGRMGLYDGADMVEAVMRIAGLKHIEIEGLFSHFPSSDEADKTVAFGQIAKFDRLVAALAERGLKARYRHLANSGALIDFPGKVEYELVRPGLALYGLYPSEEVDQNIGLRPVMSLVSRLVKVTRYDVDTPIGYGSTFIAKADSTIGIVPIGYGDGYPRALSNSGSAIVGGGRVPLAGRVSMDMIALDLSSLSKSASVGDEVILIGASSGETIEIAQIAKLTGTVAHEIPCRITTRVPRIYTRHGEVIAIRSTRRG